MSDICPVCGKGETENIDLSPDPQVHAWMPKTVSHLACVLKQAAALEQFATIEGDYTEVSRYAKHEHEARVKADEQAAEYMAMRNEMRDVAFANKERAERAETEIRQLQATILPTSAKRSDQAKLPRWFLLGLYFGFGTAIGVCVWMAARALGWFA